MEWLCWKSNLYQRIYSAQNCFDMKHQLFQRIAVLVLTFMVVGCGPIVFNKGEHFNKSIWMDGKYPYYDYAGEYNGMELYVSNPSRQQYHEDAGLLVQYGNVYQVLSKQDLDVIKKDMTAKQVREEKARRVAQAKADSLQRQKAEKTKRDRELAAENQRLLRESCLGSGPIGVCQKSKQNQSVYVCNPGLLYTDYSLALQYCYTTDRYSITSYLEVRNNLDRPVRDVVFTCHQVANSGTVLSSTSQTIYDIWQPNQVRNVSIKVEKHNQVNYMECKPTSWK